jgi:flavin reductase (DIM6/NTAB) family NADH-FMN oxidoreductase RutF
MDLDLSTMSGGQVYALMTQTILPRPVAWILSADAEGRTNLAPFSYFMPVTGRPPLLAVSVGNREPGVPKDTARNIRETGRFVVHIAHQDLLEAVNDSATPLEPDASEVDAIGLETVPFGDFPLPRLAAARVALACTLHRGVRVGDGPQNLMIGEIHHAFVDDALWTEDAKGRPAVDPQRLDPISRLGGIAYAGLGRLTELMRKKTLD